MRPSRSILATLSIALLFAAENTAHSQEPVAKVTRLAGSDASIHTDYVRILLDGSLSPAASTDEQAPPRLTAQCMNDAAGKRTFELYVNFGGVSDTEYHGPWQPTPGHARRAPRRFKKLTFEFSGYMKQKPMKYEFELVTDRPGEYRYNPTGMHSTNLMDAPFLLRYMLALPITRVSLETTSVEFNTAPFLTELRKTPICSAAGL